MTRSEKWNHLVEDKTSLVIRLSDYIDKLENEIDKLNEDIDIKDLKIKKLTEELEELRSDIQIEFRNKVFGYGE